MAFALKNPRAVPGHVLEIIRVSEERKWGARVVEGGEGRGGRWELIGSDQSRPSSRTVGQVHVRDEHTPSRIMYECLD